VRGANYCKPCKAGASRINMKHMLVSLSKSIIQQSLQEELESHQHKYEYHRKLAQEYEELVQQTQSKLEEFIWWKSLQNAQAVIQQILLWSCGVFQYGILIWIPHRKNERWS
jgi:hypothetical protein